MNGSKNNCCENNCKNNVLFVIIYHILFNFVLSKAVMCANLIEFRREIFLDEIRNSTWD